jgi:cobyrinic acid a,c-diamide synthase
MSGRIVIAGTHSGVGKTTVTVGLIDALRRRGLSVQPFKVGPDYIDPTYHALAAGRPCRNLDTWMLPPARVRSCFERAAATADVALIEGVMGLYDGSEYEDESGSTAEVAKLLRAPVVLVLDAGQLARSAGAIALGYQRFDEALPVVGFIVNRVASARHAQGVTAAIERATGLPVLGWLPRTEDLQIPERHLGLIPTAEPGRWREFARAAGAAVTKHLELDRLLAIAAQVTAEIREDAADSFLTPDPWPLTPARPVIALARDEAFTFTYEDNLNLLRAAGAEIVSFSPLRDESLPERTAGVLLCGGFPEVYAQQLSANRALHAELRAAHHQRLPFYAECGGLMYLTEAIQDCSGGTHSMVGLLPGRCAMGERLSLGYRVARSAGASWFLNEGEEIRGHEFHYSAWHDRPADLPPAYVLLPRSGGCEARLEGARVGNLWASYVHVHFGAKPELAGRFVEACLHASVGAGACAPGGCR